MYPGQRSRWHTSNPSDPKSMVRAGKLPHGKGKEACLQISPIISRGPQSHTWLGLGLGYHWRRRGARARNCLMELLVFRHAGRGVGLCEQKCRRDFVYRAFFLLTPEEIHASTCPTITQIGCFLKFRVPLTKRFAEMPRSRQAHGQHSKTNNIPEQANLSA